MLGKNVYFSKTMLELLDFGEKMTAKLGIIGGGAAGIACAITAAQKGMDVTIFDHSPRIGKKLLMTGNGKCNFTNQYMNAEQFYCDEPSFVKKLLSNVDTKDILSFFDTLGLCYKEKNGYFYPLSGQAASVLDVLMNALNANGVEVIVSANIQSVVPKNEHILVTSDSGQYEFDALVLACGGMSYPVTGSDGSGYKLCKELGISLKKPVPALCGLVCQGKEFKAVSGVRTDAEVSLYINDSFVGKESGELQLTDYGISGILVFQLSRYVSRVLADTKKPIISMRIDLLPELSEQEVIQYLRDIFYRAGKLTLAEALSGLLNKKINLFLLKKLDLRANDLAGTITEKQIKKLAKLCKNWIVTVEGTNGFDKCQVTSGGVLISELDENFAVKKIPNVYTIGELVDVDGKCGGYNLHFAFGSGMIAANDMVRRFA